MAMPMAIAMAVEVNGRRLKAMDSDGRQWKAMEGNGRQWEAMEGNGGQWKADARIDRRSYLKSTFSHLEPRS